MQSKRAVLSSLGQLNNVKLNKQCVEVPEWGCDVWVWELTGAEIDAYRQSMLKTRGAKVVGLQLSGNTARLLTYAIRDEDGRRIFEDHDIDRLQALPSSGIERLADVARKLSRLSDSDEEELAGNSDSELTDDSISNSPDTSDAL